MSLLLESEFSIHGYTMFFIKVRTDHARGIIIYVDCNLDSVEVHYIFTFSEFLFVNILENGKCKISVVAFYRSPSSSLNNDLNMLKPINFVCKTCDRKLLLTGDFKFRELIETIGYFKEISCLTRLSMDNTFLASLRYSLLLQHVNFPARPRGQQTPHLLDLVITNDD